MRSSGRRAAHESVAVGPGLSVFPVGRARGSAGTHRAGASEGGRRGAMGAVCGRGRCRTVEHSLSHYLGLPGRPLEVPCQPPGFPAVWENGQRACKGLLSRSASGARTHSQTVCALRSHHSITLLVACCFARRDGVAHAGAPTIPDGGRVGRRRVHRGSSRRTLNTDDVLMIH